MRTWPPGVSWYSSESAQLIASGAQRGTVTAMVPPGAQHPGQLAHGGRVVGDVLEHLGGDDPVERAVGEGQAQARRPGQPSPGGPASSSPASTMAPNVARTCATSSAPGVEGDHRRRRGAPPRRRGDRSRSRDRAPGRPGRRRAGRSRRSASGSALPDGRPAERHRATAGAPGQRPALEDACVAGGGARGGHLPGEAADDPLAAGRPEPGPQGRVVEQAADGAGQRTGVVGRRRAGRSPRRCPPPRAARHRWWPPRRRRRTWPRSPAARTPRRARARPRPRPRRRGGRARRR